MRSFYISITVIFCAFLLLYGSAKAYENIRATAYAEYGGAIESENSGIRIFDFFIKY